MGAHSACTMQMERDACELITTLKKKKTILPSKDNMAAIHIYCTRAVELRLSSSPYSLQRHQASELLQRAGDNPSVIRRERPCSACITVWTECYIYVLMGESRKIEATGSLEEPRTPKVKLSQRRGWHQQCEFAEAHRRRISAARAHRSCGERCLPSEPF